MGCAQSRIENEESVARCKERKSFMKEAVSARNAFASGHSGYAVALKNIGAALSDYGQGEVVGGGPGDPSSGPPPLPPPPPPSVMESTLPPPPPPLPRFSPAPSLQRAMTMPEFPVLEQPSRNMKSVAIDEDGEEGGHGIDKESNFKLRNRRSGAGDVGPSTPQTPQSPLRTPAPPSPPDSKGMAWDYFFMVENMTGPSLSEVDDINEQNDENVSGGPGGKYNVNKNVGGSIGGVEPKTPENVVVGGFVMEEEETPAMVNKEKHFTHSNTAPPDIIRRVNASKVGSSVNLLKILSDIDDHFLKASESAQEVTKMLEATRLHYHSNFADNQGHIDHAARVMRVITWNRSSRGVPNGDGGKDDFDAEEYETHATVLDKLLAWEKRLYEEVKAGELVKIEYQRKVSLLNKLKKRGASTESLEKTKAAVSHLHTRYIVDMQSLDSTASEVNHIRDDQLYPKLVALVDGNAKMWQSICIHHDSQLKIVTDRKSLEVPVTPLETTKHHYERTRQLWEFVQQWHQEFEKLVTNQKHYIQALNNWLKLNLVPIESSLKEKISSPPTVQNPPIEPLLHAWHDHLEKLPDQLAKYAIESFAAVIKTIIDYQEEEMRLKEKSEETRKEYLRKSESFEEWYQKYMQRRTPPDEMDPERSVETNPKDPVTEKQFVVESLKKRLEGEIEAHQKHCLQVRDKSLTSLQIRLPELFRAMSDYSHACLDAYERLRSLTQSQNPCGDS